MVLTSLYMQRGDTAKALSVAEGLVKGSRDNLSALNLLGAIRAASGDVAGARAAYEQVLQRDPDFVPAQLNLARVEAEEGRPDAARARLTTLFNKRKNDARVMHELGLLAQREGDMTEAIDWLRKAAAKQPDEPRAALALVEVLHATRQSGAALLAAKEVGLADTGTLVQRLRRIRKCLRGIFRMQECQARHVLSILAVRSCPCGRVRGLGRCPCIHRYAHAHVRGSCRSP